MPQAYLIFHLNLAFSSIPESARPTVIARCYHPLLDLCEATGIPVGIELTGWTLETIEAVDPGWVRRFRAMLDARRCELIGSGYTQLIGPLVPYQVNRWNQRLGLQAYERLLGRRPEIALVNEMAFAPGLVDVYRDKGYRGLVMDRDNVRLALDIEHEPLANVPTHARGPGGATLPVLWADSILFQKLQHYVHGDIRKVDYLDYLRQRIAAGETMLPLYANDAEVFDFRPGRFHVESPTHEQGEWNRLREILEAVASAGLCRWCSPSEAAAAVERSPVRASSLVGAAHPIPVKKQAKYNVARWAVSGRNSTWLNTACHRLAARLERQAEGGDPEDWRELCQFWASDLRTHITQERWDRAMAQLAAFAARLGCDLDNAEPVPVAPGPRPGTGPEWPAVDGVSIEADQEGILLRVSTAGTRLVLNLRRGLSLHSVAFRGHDFVPVLGTLPHGYFRGIGLGADFYTGGVVIELPEQHARVADLDRVRPEVVVTPEGLEFRAWIPTRIGGIFKRVIVHRDRESVEVAVTFPGWERTRSVVRAANLTLLPEAFAGTLRWSCANGGRFADVHEMVGGVDHGAPAASLVSCTTGLGATEGELRIGDASRSVVARWDPGECAAMPMILHKPSHPHALTRVFFSLQELDDTVRAGGALLGFRLSLSPGPGIPPATPT